MQNARVKSKALPCTRCQICTRYAWLLRYRRCVASRVEDPTTCLPATLLAPLSLLGSAHFFPQSYRLIDAAYRLFAASYLSFFGYFLPFLVIFENLLGLCKLDEPQNSMANMIVLVSTVEQFADGNIVEESAAIYLRIYLSVWLMLLRITLDKSKARLASILQYRMRIRFSRPSNLYA